MHRHPTLLLLSALLLTLPASAEQPRKKVLIIGIDGLRPDALQAAKTPVLDRLIRSGAYSGRARTGDRTSSGPGWSSMLTGVWRDKHGVADNSFKGARYDRYPHFFKHVKAARPKALTASIVHWAPIQRRIVSHADVAVAVPTDAQVTRRAITLLQTQDPTVVFLHLDDVDHAGHAKGFDPKQPAYLAAIRTVDRQIGQILGALRARKTHAREDWLILASTDHGGRGRSHGANTPAERTIFLLVSGGAAARGEISPPPAIVDVPATALTHLGIPIQPSWNWDGRPVGLAANQR